MERSQGGADTWTPRGLLNKRAAEPKFTLTRHLPSPDIAFFVKHYWIVRWDLRGQEPYVQQNVPHPCVNLVFEEGNSRVYGVIPRTYSHTIEGEGHVLGIKFEPGGFQPFVKTSMATLSGKSMTVGDAFGIDLGRVASSLGYFGQAHFARDFRAMVGKSPTEYVRAASPHSPAA